MNKRSLIAIAAAAAISPVIVRAQAAEEPGYQRFGGSVDAVVRRDSGPAAGAAWGVQPGGARSSRLTWSMKELMGPDLAATVALEGAFNPDTGTGGTSPVPATPTAGFTFNRVAHVGLGSDQMGYITLGRQFTPMQAVTAGPVNDPFGGAWLGGIATIYNKTSGASNAILYSRGYSAEASVRPAPRNGLGIMAMYAFGEEPSPLAGAGNQYGFNASYGGENWWLGYAYHRQEGNNATLNPAIATSLDPKTTFQYVGGAVEFWKVRVSLGLNTGKASNNTLDRQNLSLGVLWNVSERGTIRFLYGRADDRTAANADFRTTQAAYMYDLSKRTGVYVVWGNVNNSPNAAVALSGAIGTVPKGAQAKSVALGIKHVF